MVEELIISFMATAGFFICAGVFYKVGKVVVDSLIEATFHSSATAIGIFMLSWLYLYMNHFNS